MVFLVDAPVLKVTALPRQNCLLTIGAPEVARNCLPGQFVMVSVEDDQALPFPLLKRALAIYSVGREEERPGSIGLLLKAVGDGTRRLASLASGDVVHLVGPLGNGFDLTAAKDRVNFLVAGGIGIASLCLLAEELTRSGQDVHLVYGGRTHQDLVCLEDFRKLGVELFLTTDDGSAGFPGLVSDGLSEYLSRFPTDRSMFYVCGPSPMMKAVSAVAARHHIPCQISVETRMACGFGVCLGCTVKTVDSYRLACTDGPVFEANRFIWEAS